MITSTVEGVKTEGGVSGFFSGLGKGLVGTVTKPMAGALDFASETAQTVRDMASLSNRYFFSQLCIQVIFSIMEEDDRNIYMNALSVAFCMALFQLQGARACAQAGIENSIHFFKTKAANQSGKIDGKTRLWKLCSNVTLHSGSSHLIFNDCLKLFKFCWNLLISVFLFYLMNIASHAACDCIKLLKTTNIRSGKQRP